MTRLGVGRGIAATIGAVALVASGVLLMRDAADQGEATAPGGPAATSGACPATDDLVPITERDEQIVVKTARRFLRALREPHFDPDVLWSLSDPWFRQRAGWSSPVDIEGSWDGIPFPADPQGFISHRAQSIATRNGSLDAEKARDFLLARAGIASEACGETLRERLASATWWVAHGCRGCTPAYALVVHRADRFKVLVV